MPRPEYGPIPEGVDLRWTSSSLESFLRCSLRYRLDRQGERWSTVKMAIGTAVHAGARSDAVSKRDNGRGLRLPDLVECAIEGYNEEVSQSEIDASRSELNKGKDDVAVATLEYGKSISPLILPESIKAIEEPMSMVLRLEDIGMTIEFAGTPDRLEGAGVGDTKTGRQWHHQHVRSARQLTGYGWLMFAEKGSYPQFVFVDNVMRYKRGWVAKRVTTRRIDQDYDAFFDLLSRATHAFCLGVELPAPESAWYCAEGTCPHWRRCPAIIGKDHAST